MRRFVSKKAGWVVLVALIGSVFSAKAQSGEWAVGFRIGEPAGVNVRKYMGTAQALDFNIGTYGGMYGTERNYRRGRYRTVGISLQAHYLWLGEAGKVAGLRYYYGFGGQLNSRRYYPDMILNVYANEVSLGGSAVAGLEYFIPNRRASVFLETGLYLEAVPYPFFIGVQSGVGVRYNL